MRISETKIAGAVLLEPALFRDDRGYFMETWVRSKYLDAGINDHFVQDDASWSERGVLRGLHGDRNMAKLVSAVIGQVFDVIVDAREGSATRGKWQAFSLTQEPYQQLYVPAGCLHGFLVLSEFAFMTYKHSAEYDSSAEFGVRWDDSDLQIAWPTGVDVKLSERDRRLPPFREITTSF